MPVVRVLSKGKRYNRRYNKGSNKAMKRQMLRPKIRVRGRYRLTQPVHYFTRFQNQGTISLTNGTTSTFGVVYWNLASIPGYTEFSAMYDFYKINAVSVRFIPISNVNLSGNSTLEIQTTYYNRFISVIDYNDRGVPTSLDDLRQYSNCRVSPNNVVHKRFLHPRPTIAVDEDSGSGGSYGIGQASGRTTWITTASNQCEWYGIKYGIQHANPGATIGAYNIETKVYLSFKGRN